MLILREKIKKQDYSPKNFNGKRIFYALCGEGMGHAIRSGIVIKHLLKKNEVAIFASNRGYNYLSKKFNNVYRIEGFNGVYESNTLNFVKMFINNFKDIPHDLKNNLILMYKVAKIFKPNLIISDFEFYSNLFSKIIRIPLISLDHTHVLTKCKIKVPKKYLGARIMGEGVVRTMIQFSHKYLITNYFYPPVKNPLKVKIYPPILRDEILKLKPKNGEHILVYQTSESNVDLLNLLKEFEYKFIFYGFHEEKKDVNLIFKPFNEFSFFEDLASSKAVITNGGFNLITEALYLEKPVFSIPVKNHYEQIVNAIYLERSGYGEFNERPKKKELERFLSKLDLYRENINFKFIHDENKNLFRDLDKIIEEN